MHLCIMNRPKFFSIKLLSGNLDVNIRLENLTNRSLSGILLEKLRKRDMTNVYLDKRLQMCFYDWDFRK